MGRKRARTRELIYFCAAGLICLVLLSCALLKEKDKVGLERNGIQKEKVRSEESRSEESRIEKSRSEESRKEEALKISSEHLLRAKRLLEQKDYDGSLKESQLVLSLSGQNPPGDEALFSMGLIYAHFGNPRKDYGKSIVFLKKLVKDYPQSAFAEQARIWVRVLQENEKLEQTIQKLNQIIEESKQVDIEIEEKKREKAK